MRSSHSTLLLLALPLLLAGCTVASTEPGLDGQHKVVGHASCVGFCKPERDAILERMHDTCAWPAVPAVLAKGTRGNGLIGVPHAIWRFDCLTVGPDTQVASDDE